MNPLVSLDLARLHVEELRREADAWRAASAVRRPARVRLGEGLQRLGERVAGAAPVAPTPVRRRRAVARLP